MSRRPDKVVYFAKEDKLEFLNIIGKYKEHFDRNDFSELNVKTKKAFWKLIEKEYNDISPKTGPRTGEQLQCLYKNLKRKARNDAIREIGSLRNIQCTMDDSNDSNQNQDSDPIAVGDEPQYIYVKPSLRSSDCVSEIAESSTLNMNEEYVVEPLITLETIQNSVSSNYYNRPSPVEAAFIKQKIEPVSSTKRSNDEEFTLRIKILKVELENKKREASLNYETSLLRKEIEWKNKETATLVKKAKLEEINDRRDLMKLKQENEILRNKLLKIELVKAQKSLSDISNSEGQTNINLNDPSASEPEDF